MFQEKGPYFPLNFARTLSSVLPLSKKWESEVSLLGVENDDEEEAPKRDADDPPKKDAAEEAGCPKGFPKAELEAAALLPPKLKPVLPPNRLLPPPVEEPKLKPPPDCMPRL